MHVGSKTSCGYGEATEEELMDAMAMVSSKVSSSNHKMEARWSNIGFMANRGSEAEEDNHFGLLCDDNDDDQCSSQNNNNNSMDLQLASFLPIQAHLLYRKFTLKGGAGLSSTPLLTFTDIY
ncbi:hypothetical protein L3X38_012853 [Prunus dulcis]|uniref:Uncharacterized protein n=1 Tax=Prunus dulcis TaxID=3755 RepID=A0AAD4ZGS6_PRUDU|nr:hypothetical protein L3X38_012853 [Prunus dulcis]